MPISRTRSRFTAVLAVMLTALLACDGAPGEQGRLDDELRQRSVAPPTFTGVTAGSLVVSWIGVRSATEYQLERAPDAGGAPGQFEPIAAVPATITTHADVDLAATTTYWYRVLARSRWRVIGMSDGASVTTLAIDVEPPPPPPTCTEFTYGEWVPSICPSSGEQTRTVTTSSPDGCTGGAPVLTQACTPPPAPPPTCTAFTYTVWTPSACPTSGQQTRTVVSSSPAGCTGGAPVLTQACTPPAPTPPTCTSFTYAPWAPSVCPTSGQQARTVVSSSPAGCTGGAPVLTQTCTPPTSSSPFPPDTRMVKHPMPSAAEPPLYGTVKNLGTSWGLSSPDGDTITTRAADVGHHYPKDSPWNVDESLAMLSNGQIVNGRTYAPTGKSIFSGPVSANEHRAWSHVDPRWVYGAHYQNRQWIRMDATNPANNVVLKTYTAADVGLSSLSNVSFGSYESDLDLYDSAAALIANDVRPFVIDPKTGAVRCVVTGGGGYGRSVSDATVSQDGRYLIVNWGGYGLDAYSTSSCGFVRKLTSWGSHYDTCVSTAGEQVVVQIPGPLVMVRISDGAQTTAFNGDTNFYGHISCRNVKRPGWAYLSIFNDGCQVGSPAYNSVAFHRVWALRLDGSQTVENFAWDRQACPNGGYAEQPKAAASPSGTRVWFKANWGSGVHSFVAGR